MQDLDELYRAAIRLHQQGNAPAAAKAYETILNARPDHAGALHLKGVLALQAADYDDAIALIQRSLHLMPRHALAWSNLSVALRAKNRLTEAIAALKKALAIGPETAEAWGNLTRTQMEAGFIPQSVASAYKAIRLRADDLGARQFAIFGSNYLGETDPLTLKDEARQFGLIAERLVPQRNHHDNDRNPDRVIRVGLVCADMRAHAVGRFLISFLDQLDPQKIELIAYSESAKPTLCKTLSPICATYRSPARTRTGTPI